jgi:hypothetical protein
MCIHTCIHACELGGSNINSLHLLHNTNNRLLHNINSRRLLHNINSRLLHNINSRRLLHNINSRRLLHAQEEVGGMLMIYVVCLCVCACHCHVTVTVTDNLFKHELQKSPRPSPFVPRLLR